MGWKDAPEVGAPAGAWASAPEVEAPAQPSAQTLAVRKAEEERAKGTFRQNLAAGLVRGAGSIGATIMWPIDKITDKVMGDREQNLSSLITGEKPISRNEERRQAMTNALAMMGANPDSLAFKGGKIGGEIAGTAGAGGAVGNLLARAPVVATVAPGFVNAVRTSGMTTGQSVAPGAVNALRDLSLRAAGGAVTGGVSAGMVDPNDATTGAVIGGALPGATKVLGQVGSAAGRLLRGPEVPDATKAAVVAAREAGYVVPPTQASPTLVNRAVEGLGGKLTVAQNASAKNQEVTTNLAKQALGLADDVKLSVEALDGVRKEAGKAYDAVSKAGKFNATGAKLPGGVSVETSIDPLIGGKVQSVDSAELVRAWRQANHDATGYFRAYGRDANPETLTKAKNAAADAKAIDKFMTEQLEAAGKSDLVQALKEARVRIAKTHTVEAALNPATGNVDAQKLAQMLKKDKPLSGELRQAAEFATAFPKAAQPMERMGSLPQTSPLDWAAAGSVSAATANPLMMAGVLARPAARATALSPFVQNRLGATPSPNALAELLTGPTAQELLYRSAPVAISGR